MTRFWFNVLATAFVTALVSCGGNPNQASDNTTFNVSLRTQNAAVTPRNYFLIPLVATSSESTPLSFTRVVMSYNPNLLRFIGTQTTENNDINSSEILEMSTPTSKSITFDFIGSRNGIDTNQIAFQLLGDQTDSVNFQLMAAATSTGKNRQFASEKDLRTLPATTTATITAGTGGLSSAPNLGTDRAGLVIPVTNLNLEVPAKLEASWTGVEMGDLDGDKTVTQTDMDLLQKALVSQVTLTPIQRYASDLKGDNVIDDYDYAYLYVKKLNIELGYGQSKPPYAVVHADTTIVPGEPALMIVGNSGSLQPLSNTSYTLSNSQKWLQDALPNTGSSSDAYTVTPALQTPTAQASEFGFVFAPGGAARRVLGTNRIMTSVLPSTESAVSIALRPSAVLFTAANQTKTLQLLAYNANGQRVAVNPTEFNWVVNDPNQVSLINNNDGTVSMTSKTAIGSAFVTARNASGSLIANPAAITTATPKPDVVILPDSSVLFPPIGVSNATLTAGVNVNGVASFTGAELAAYLEVPTPSTAKYPVVLRGTAPTVGSLVVSGEGSSVFGRVIQTQTRGAYSLVQLQLVPFPEAFSALELKANSTELQAQGLLPSTLALKQTSGNPTNKRTTRAGTQNSPLKIGNCTITGGFSLGSIKAEGELTVDPFFEFTASTSTNSLNLRTGADVKISLLVTTILTPTLTAKAECPLIDPLNIDIPLSGPFYKLLTGRISNQPYFEAELKGQGGGSITAIYKPEFAARVGFDLKINNGNPQFTNLWDTSKSQNPAPTITLSSTSSEKIPLKLYGSAFLNWRAEVGVQLLTLMFDFTDYIPPSSFREKFEQLEKNLFVKFLTIKAGPKLGIGWGNTAYTLQQRIPGSGAEINGVVEGELGFKQLENYTETFLGKAIPLTFPLKFNAIKFPFYSGVKPNLLSVNGQKVEQKVDDANQHPPIEIKRNTTVQVDVDPEVAVGDEFSDVVNGIPDALKSRNEISLYTKSTNGVYSQITDPFTVTPGGLVPNAIKISSPSSTLCGPGSTDNPLAVYVVYTNKFLNLDLVNAPSLAGSFRIQCEPDPDAKIEFSEKVYALGAKLNGSLTRKLLIKNIGSKDLKLQVATDPLLLEWLRLEGDLSILERDLPVGKIVEVSFVAKCLGVAQTYIAAISVSAASVDLNWPATGGGDAAVKLVCDKEPRILPNGDLAGGWGDPHLNSFDKLNFDFQGAGEFIYTKAKDPTDPFQVQVRFIPSTNQYGSVSFNNAFAMNVNGDRLSIFPTPNNSSTFDIMVNGQKQTFDGNGDLSVTLPNGGQVSAQQGNQGFADVRWKDGYAFSANTYYPGGTSIWGSGMVYVPATKRGQVEGLLGNDNQDPSDDMALRDGTVLTQPVSFKDIYQRLGSRSTGWRISQSESLFDYEPGKNTDTYTDFNFPPGTIGIENLPTDVRDNAEAICRAAGVVDTETLINCILDVALTGNSAFAKIAKAADPIAKSISLSPSKLTLETGKTYRFIADVKGVNDPMVTWTATGGSIAPDGLYTAPATAGTYTVTVRSVQDANLSSSSTVAVTTAGTITPRIFSASNVNFFLNSSGQVYAWGVNDAGQLGLGFTSVSQNTPRIILGLTGVQNIETNGSSSFALTRDGKVYAWGKNLDSLLGLGLAENTSVLNPTQINSLPSVKTIKMSGSSASVVTREGQVYDWGYNSGKRLNLGTYINQKTPALISSMSSIQDIEIDRDFTIAIGKNGKVYGWGRSFEFLWNDGIQYHETPTIIPELENIKKVVLNSSSLYIAYALTQDGKVYTWGRGNSNGQLGLGDYRYTQTLPILIPNLNNIRNIESKGSSAYALTLDNKIYSWGYNADGELGLGIYDFRVNSPRLISDLTDVQNISVAGSTFALTSDARVRAWGPNGSGQLGLGFYGNTGVFAPTLIPSLLDVQSVTPSQSSTFALTQNGQIYAWGNNKVGQLGLGFNSTQVTVPTLVQFPIQQELKAPPK
jgi:alpha-tubulin suppressor-like RCC1 family protein